MSGPYPEVPPRSACPHRGRRSPLSCRAQPAALCGPATTRRWPSILVVIAARRRAVSSEPRQTHCRSAPGTRRTPCDPPERRRGHRLASACTCRNVEADPQVGRPTRSAGRTTGAAGGIEVLGGWAAIKITQPRASKPSIPQQMLRVARVQRGQAIRRHGAGLQIDASMKTIAGAFSLPDSNRCDREAPTPRTS